MPLFTNCPEEAFSETYRIRGTERGPGLLLDPDPLRPRPSFYACWPSEFPRIGAFPIGEWLVAIVVPLQLVAVPLLAAEDIGAEDIGAEEDIVVESIGSAGESAVVVVEVIVYNQNEDNGRAYYERHLGRVASIH